ncbi:MAG: glutamate-5-semialdehyde dehydrogenase [Clostridia bacterium]|nr:glutamate-5-semialdehyde dehydrogenase [Clostridia bacterium]
MHVLSTNAREAYYTLSSASAGQRNHALLSMAAELDSHADQLFQENQLDLDEAEQSGLATPLLSRLRFGPEKLKQVIDGLHSLAALPDPLGKTTLSRELTEGLALYRVTCPIGVLGIIFESRPDALVQIASLAVKSGNAALMKGGKEALRTNRALAACVVGGIVAAGLPAASIQLLESREDVRNMLREDELIDLIIPRGGNDFVRYIMDNSRIPVLGHADGICHVYIDRDADPETACRVALDSKTQNVSVCNAMETLLIHSDIAPSLLPKLAAKLREKGVRILGDEQTRSIIDCEAATEKDWETEYLDLVLSVRIVPSITDAIAHINHYGSHHTDAIVTRDQDRASRFLQQVDSAGVYWNASTRFADGYVYGFGAEVGIATGKIHARGPMGLDGLTTYKYKLLGAGHILAEMKSGDRKYTHVDLNRNCPL